MARMNEIYSNNGQRLFEIFNIYGERLFADYWPADPTLPQKNLVEHIHGHASGQDTPHNRIFAGVFNERGHPTLRIEARHSNSNGADGEIDGFTMGGNVDDVKTPLRCVQLYQGDWLKAGKPILSGHSMGGYSVLRAAVN